jgi:Outer membrane protein beta-barrel domain
MSDFDKRLSNMMNEDEHFPNMQQNWERLSPHLQPPQPLKTSYLQKPWFIGIAASVSVLAVSAMSYFLFKTNQENKALQSELTILKNKTQNIDNKTITHNDNNAIDKKNNPVNAPKNSVSSSENLDKKEVLDKILSEPKTNNTLSNNPVSPRKTSEIGNKNNVEKAIQMPSQANNIVTQNKIIEERGPSVFLEKKEILAKKQAIERVNIVQNEVPMPSKKLENNLIIVPSEYKESSSANILNNTNAPIQNSETATATSIKKTDLAVSPLGILLKPTIVNITKEPLSMEGLLMQSPVVIRSTHRTKRFAIGVQAFASVGENEGRERRGPALNGLGLIASYNLTRNFELMASVDLGGMRYDFKEGPKGNRIPKEPRDKPKDHPRLRGVSGKQDRQQFSIGLKYKLPLNTILIPSLSVGYDLQRLGKQDCRFDFVNDTTNTEVTVQQVIEPQISKNLWHLGAGVEANVYSFNLSLSAQYQKDFSINNDNRIILRAGVKYRF